jgi:hypothetical protein
MYDSQGTDAIVVDYNNPDNGLIPLLPVYLSDNFQDTCKFVQ